MSEPLIGRLVRERGALTRHFPPKAPAFADPDPPLSQPTRDRLAQLGIETLFSHQAQAVSLANQGRDVMVVTGTGSGKSLCYSLPILETCRSEPMARAIAIFPTKALAHDQLGKLEALFEGSHVRAATYDGDTPKNHRGTARKEANVILTNPDMLHVGILPRHEDWTRFLKNLRYIVVDEAHTYRGVFGGHMGWIVRRLLRLCQWHGSRPTVIGSSATVANPEDLFFALTGRQASLVDADGGPSGERTVVLVPPALAEGDAKSPNVVCGELAAEMVQNGLKVIVFCRARVTAELVCRIARQRAENSGTEGLVASYRGGYTPSERREIERSLFSGELRALVSTSAMELGVDVGGLDCVVLNGYPGRVSSFWQQIGRAGRAGADGLGILVAHDDPLELYLCSDPERLLGTSGEPVVPSLANKYVAAAQLRCAAHERPLGESDVPLLEISPEGIAHETASGTLVESSGLVYYAKHDSPAGNVNIRNTSGQSVALRADGQVVGDMERWRALQWAHPGAVYLHQSKTYVVEDLDLVRNEARLVEGDQDHYTIPTVTGLVEQAHTIDSASFGAFSACLAALKVTTSVSGFRRVAIHGGQVEEEVPLNLPPLNIDTVGVRLDMPYGIESVADEAVVSALQGVERLLGALAPTFAGCDRSDLSTSWYLVSPDTLRSAVFVYDAAPGGLGLAEVLFPRLAPLLQACHRVAAECGCADGCPLCVVGQGQARGPASRKETESLLSRIVASLGSA